MTDLTCILIMLAKIQPLGEVRVRHHDSSALAHRPVDNRLAVKHAILTALTFPGSADDARVFSRVLVNQDKRSALNGGEAGENRLQHPFSDLVKVQGLHQDG
jgi:hypothetical protein